MTAAVTLLGLSDGALVSAEEFAERHFTAKGYQVIHSESRPFHALFGIYMFLLIQDPGDPRNRMVTFGSRTAFDTKTKAPPIWTSLPEDFGTSGYYTHRRRQIRKHLSSLDESDWRTRPRRNLSDAKRAK
jgi:hypothetical protein